MKSTSTNGSSNRADVHSLTHSLWHRDLPVRQQFPPLGGKHRTDVLVVGGGITGLTTAIEMAERGYSVTLCEAEAIGAGTTAASTGHLDAHPEMGPRQLVDKLGLEDARTYVRLRTAAIDRIERFADQVSDFKRIAAYQYSEVDDDIDDLKQQWESAVGLGLDADWVDSIPISRARCGYRLNSMARIHIGNYLHRLTELAVQKNVTIFEGTLVSGITEKETHVLKAGNGEVSFDRVVGAVHCNHTGALILYAATPPYQSYAIAAHVREDLDDALFWDNSNPYFYVRRANSHDAKLIIAGGCDHRTGTTDEGNNLRRLEDWLHQRFQVDGIAATWSAELFEPIDGLPMIGRGPGKKNAWLATGLSGVGLTWGTAAAMLIADGIEGKPFALKKQLDPGRTGLSSPADWLREQATTTANYAERVLPADRIDTEQVGEGQGTVGKLDGAHVAFCRDEDGCEHRLSPICPHMGGVLHFNEVEHTWDCPVHGGRFTASGKRLYGPPESDMNAIDSSD
ncbi:FAD-dependent oxidoreductase [Neorhodopirellula pilleata]|uniref:Gamma-glutamylputrescine oxidoreductase n=1 Tax=Neorhodopirellula pilleata TaxID=2714738 RepID=A0A5C6AHG9_9BACT|nr:FAD-dependent oxidoreductase [Neorhodopirellula pilleata]TWT98907.1 Gamma-glutamylputrescine oxidoreductase [Neorhodopirellula pilleata]